MSNLLDYPLLVFVLTFFGLWLAARLAATTLRRLWAPRGNIAKTSASSWRLR